MTEQEEYELALQLAAHEKLLAELLVLVRAQRGSSKRLSDYRDRLAAQLEPDEDKPVPMNPKEQAIQGRVLEIVDSALGLLAENRRRMREQG